MRKGKEAAGIVGLPILCHVKRNYPKNNSGRIRDEATVHSVTAVTESSRGYKLGY